MEINEFTSLTPLIVAITGGLFVIISSTTAKEKETKLIKYESLGFDVFKFFESNTQYLAKIYMGIDYTIKKKARLSLSDVDEIIAQTNVNRPPLESVRELSVRLSFIDKKSHAAYESYLKKFDCFFNKFANIVPIPYPEDIDYKSEHSEQDLKEIKSLLNKLLKETEEVKSNIIKTLSKKYHLTLNQSKNFSIAAAVIIVVFLAMVFI